jgi:hypothetical protein
VRRHAKAASARSATDRGRLLGPLLWPLFFAATLSAGRSGAPRETTDSGASLSQTLAAVLIGVLSLGALLFSAAPTFAATVTDRPFLFSFNGDDTTAGEFATPESVAADEATGDVFVLDFRGVGDIVLDKFNAAGVAEDFSAAATSSLPVLQRISNPGGHPSVAVDNSAVHPGRIYVIGGEQSAGTLAALSPDGTPVWEITGDTVGTGCGVTVDASGHPWIIDQSTQTVREFDNTGSPPPVIQSFAYTNEAAFPCALAVDANGDVYIGASDAEKGFYKYVDGQFSSTLDPDPGRGVAADSIDPSGHVFALHGENFKEFEANGTLSGTFGAGLLSGTSGIAYSHALDRVYIAEGNPFEEARQVRAFGPQITGTVPDVTVESPTEVGISKARFHGKVDPQGVPNSYFFEWKRGTGPIWASAESSPRQSLPEDSIEHPVFFDATGLSGNTTYQVRLVGVNTTNGLRSASAAEVFTTQQAGAPPTVTLDAPAVGTTTANVSGTVNPQEDSGTTWELEISTDTACAADFSSRPRHRIGSEAAAPVAISEELTGLLPNQHYCVRLTATNSAGAVTSQTREFTTQSAAPSQVHAAFAAPRTDTTARLNGYVNPEGADLRYRFEYSADGGNTWVPLADREDLGDARGRIVVAEEASGLEPGTTYSYRLVAENAAGPASPQGEVKTFSTRTSAEMTLPQRGVELVNMPDKGNQHVFVRDFESGSEAAISPDGNRFLWTVPGGAPGGTAPVFNVFMATRTDDGWKSTNLTPPAEQQVGGGFLKYVPDFVLPDFSHIIVRTEEAGLFGGPSATFIRLDSSQNQEVLGSFEENNYAGLVDATDDGSHVLHVRVTIKEKAGTLEDLGRAGAPEVVGLMQDDSEPSCGVDLSFAGGGGHAETQTLSNYHWIATTDASRVYFPSRGDNCNGPLGLYQRNRETHSTTEIAENAEFIRTTPDGRSAYFVTAESLSGDDTNTNGDVYRWDEAGGYVCLTCIVSEADVRPQGGDRFSQVLVSDDFSHVYFESTHQLVAGLGTAGVSNLYVLTAGDLHYVATPEDTHGSGLSGPTKGQLSANGNVLAFRAAVPLTADQIAPSCTNAGDPTPHPCEELYVYDDRNQSVECISCSHDGITTNEPEAENFGGFFHLSSDGSTVAFTTAQALVPRDVNRSLDVYQWRNGATGLITDGVTEFPSGYGAPRIAGIDEDGGNIVFSVADPGLTGYEQDLVDNLYDARIGGGFERPSAPVHCVEDSCQGPLRAAPPAPGSGSSTLTGNGNTPPAKKGRHGPCARKRGRGKRRCLREHHSHKSSKRHGKARGTK